MTPHFCTECGAPLAPDAHFCPACGHAPAPTGETGPPPTVPTPVVGPPPSMQAPATAPPAAPTVPPPGPNGPGTPSGRNRTLLIAGIAAVVLLVAVGAVLVLTGGDEASADVLLEPVGVEVPDPFTATVAIGEEALDPTAATTTAPATTGTTTADGSTSTTTRAPSPGAGGGAVVGSAPGLYGGTQDQTSCDPEKLVNFLESDPDKAAAWAQVQGIEPGGIRAFVAGLTPVLLRRDTRVLNHGYRDGRPTPRPAVLQAGTAVLVDDFGIPRVKCACGNPLDEPPPVTTATTYTGTRWSGFDPAGVVVVRADVRVDVFVLVDVRTGNPFRRPTATKGGDDTPASASTTTTTTSTTTTTAPAASEGTAAPVLFEIASIAAVSNGPTAPSVADLPAARVTAIVTYHWNDAQGATPGTVALQAADGTMYGPFPTAGSPGQGGVPNAYWTATVNVTLPAGRYTVIDSDPGTWAWAPDTGGRGMVQIHGVATTTPAPTTTRPTPTTAAPDDADRSQEAIDAVEGALCPTPGVEDWQRYITGFTATETDFLLYRVEVRIELDSGGWTALFDVDFATEGGPEIRPANDESSDLLC